MEALFSLAKEAFSQLLLERWNIPIEKSNEVWTTTFNRNRGTGAGGKNTTVSGKLFEEKASLLPYLLENGFIPTNYYYSRDTEDENVVVLTQTGFCKYVKAKFGIHCARRPDAAYVVKRGDTYTIKVIEVKNQNTSGSVIDKMLGGGSMLEYYRYIFKGKCNVEYAYAVSDFIAAEFDKREPLIILRETTFKMYNIKMFTVSTPSYHSDVMSWVLN